ncbi:MAG: hypothetical protein ACKO4N_05970 [Verrucomicrobiota bacterium]
MSGLLIKIAVLVLGGLLYGAIKRALEAPASVPPPLPPPRAPYRPRRRTAPSSAARAEKAESVPPVLAPVRAPAASVAPRRVSRFHFSGAADLRRAFVASEVLGRPVSMREPRV